MNFVADESVDREVVARLRQDGHRVLYIAEEDPGADDDPVLELANREAAPLLTADKDFGELVFRLRRVTMGVVLIRLAGLSQETKASVVASVVKGYESKLARAFCVITAGAVRIRPAPQADP